MIEDLEDYIESLDEQERLECFEYIKELMHTLSPLKSQPINRVRWVPIEMVSPNDYNPNSVAKVEMGLLYTSILHDGYTQPIVTVHDPERDMYVIIDGFHRYFTAKTNQDILDRNHGLLPIVVLDKDINDRMASTVRHNRARGEHSVSGMSNMVFQMLNNGWADHDICNELGMSAEELLKLKHITGFSKLFKDATYNRAWKTKSQVRIEKQYKASQNDLETPTTDSNPQDDGTDGTA